MNRRNFAALAGALPVALVLLAVGRAEYARVTQTTWKLPIAGYDPRDLLRGRYLQFRFSLPPRQTCDAPSTCCLCPEANGEPPIELACDLAQQRCPSDWLSSIDARGAQRFYVPETQAIELEHKLIDSARTGTAQAEFVIGSDHRPQFLRLHLGEDVIDLLDDE